MGKLGSAPDSAEDPLGPVGDPIMADTKVEKVEVSTGIQAAL